MLGQDSIVIRVGGDGSFVAVEGLPTMFLDRSLREALNEGDSATGGRGRFEQHCRQAVTSRSPISFRPDNPSDDEVLISPIVDDEDLTVRFLVCWTRHGDGLHTPVAGHSWTDLAADAVVTRYRLRSDDQSAVVEAAPWWAPDGHELVELWSHHAKISAVGLGHAVMETLIMDAAEAAAEFADAPAVRVEVPSADMLAGLVPVVHGALRASGLAPDRLITAIDVDLAVDPDLLPIIVHLRTMGVRIDIVGLDALTSTLHMVSDTSGLNIAPVPAAQCELGPWLANFADAIHTVAA